MEEGKEFEKGSSNNSSPEEEKEGPFYNLLNSSHLIILLMAGNGMGSTKLHSYTLHRDIKKNKRHSSRQEE